MLGIPAIQTINELPLNELPVGEVPHLGLRVWVPEGLRDYGLNKTCIAPNSGGTIVYEDDDGINYAIKWDDGQTTMHNAFDFAKDLICTGHCQTLSDYVMLHAESRSNNN
jgi:hypothetical protein